MGEFRLAKLQRQAADEEAHRYETRIGMLEARKKRALKDLERTVKRAEELEALRRQREEAAMQRHNTMDENRRINEAFVRHKRDMVQSARASSHIARLNSLRNNQDFVAGVHQEKEQWRQMRAEAQRRADQRSDEIKSSVAATRQGAKDQVERKKQQTLENSRAVMRHQIEENRRIVQRKTRLIGQYREL